MSIKISVIIPVYNAEKFIRKAVESAVNLSEVSEVILIEDGSPDEALNICKTLVKEYSKVKLFLHPNGENRGAGASRNLGIEHASSDYIAFLDADDYYLPERFEKEKELFLSNVDIDGVYGCIKAEFENENVRELFLNKFLSEYTTISKKIAPENLFDALLFSSYGYFSTDAITVKKNVFKVVGYFDEKLTLSQDTHMWLKLAAKCNLFPGSIDKPIAIRRVHNDNRIHSSVHKVSRYKILMYEKLLLWAIKQSDLIFERKNRIFAALHMAKNRKPEPLQLLFDLARRFPSLIFTKFFFRKIYMSLRYKDS